MSYLKKNTRETKKGELAHFSVQNPWFFRASTFYHQHLALASFYQSIVNFRHQNSFWQQQGYFKRYERSQTNKRPLSKWNIWMNFIEHLLQLELELMFVCVTSINRLHQFYNLWSVSKFKFCSTPVLLSL